MVGALKASCTFSRHNRQTCLVLCSAREKRCYQAEQRRTFHKQPCCPYIRVHRRVESARKPPWCGEVYSPLFPCCRAQGFSRCILSSVFICTDICAAWSVFLSRESGNRAVLPSWSSNQQHPRGRCDSTVVPGDRPRHVGSTPAAQCKSICNTLPSRHNISASIYSA